MTINPDESDRASARAPARLLAFAAALAACGSATAAPGPPRRVDLVVSLDGFREAKGHAIAKLYREGQDVLGRPSFLVRVDIENGRATAAFRGLLPGPYAVVAFHDKNDNGRIDHNVLGLPAEPIGFSNGFSPGIIAGMPSFEKLRFDLGATGRVVSITVR
jgi:uncharacterized protein (DUF2141 family)